MLSEIETVLDGIDRERQDGNGWWNDKSGAEFGKSKVQAIRRLLDSERRAKCDQRLAANCAKAQFLANMSHEIRTPMNGIIGIAHLLATTHLNGEQKELLRILSGSAESLMAVLADILDFSKAQTGHLKIEKRKYNFSDMIEDTLALLSPQAHRKGLEVFCDLSEKCYAQIEGDPARTRQILTNLLANAIKFTERGEIGVTARHMHSENGPGLFRIEVNDTGIGISPEKQSEIFSPFTQVETGAARRFGGTGLGLAICRKLVELMDGQIGLNSEVGSGSTFWFEIPAAELLSIKDGNADSNVA